jgi:23S rRNA (adenine1618-N6)-methyltransferase
MYVSNFLDRGSANHPTDHPLQSIARIEKMANEYLPFPTSASIDAEAAKDAIISQLSSLDLSWTWDSVTSTGIGEASQNVWSRSYRRAYERKQREGLVDMKQDAERKVELAFRIRVVDLAREVVVEWLRGNDQVLWESLCGLIHRPFKKS